MSSDFSRLKRLWQAYAATPRECPSIGMPQCRGGTMVKRGNDSGNISTLRASKQKPFLLTFDRKTNMLPLFVYRRKYGASARRSSARHARLDRSANPSRHGPAALLRYRPARQAGFRGFAQAQSRHALSCPPALVRLEQRGWISSKWGASENNRKAKFYSLTRAGRKQLLAETASWERMTALMARLLGGTEGA